jgi:hypothetical protein
MEATEIGRGRKITSIQVNGKTLFMLKKLKEDMKAPSYEEAIQKLIVKSRRPAKSFGGSLKKYFKGQSVGDMVKELQDERRKSDRV